MTKTNLVATASPETTQSGGEGAEFPSSNGAKRRSFLKGLGVAGAALSAGPLLATAAEASQRADIITVGDVAILRFLAATELIEPISGSSTTNSGESRTAKSPEEVEVQPTPPPSRFLMETWPSTFTITLKMR